MKIFKKAITVLLAIIVCLGGIIRAEAAVIEKEDIIQPNKVTIHPITGDQYSDAVFETLSAAKNKFGWCWNYQPCYEVYLGNSYNYCYFFSDGSKQFFNIIYMDDDIILDHPQDEATE